MSVWVWSARISKSGTPVRELIRVPAESVPPGCGFESRHEAKQHDKQGIRARRHEGDIVQGGGGDLSRWLP